MKCLSIFTIFKLPWRHTVEERLFPNPTLKSHLYFSGVTVYDAEDVPGPDAATARPAARAPVVHLPPEEDGN